MQTLNQQVREAAQKAREISVEIYLSGRDELLPRTRAALTHLLDHPENMDVSGPLPYLIHTHQLVNTMKWETRRFAPDLLPLVEELLELVLPAEED